MGVMRYTAIFGLVGLLLMTAAPVASSQDNGSICVEPYPAYAEITLTDISTQGFTNGELPPATTGTITWSFEYWAHQLAWSFVPITAHFEFTNEDEWLSLAPSHVTRALTVDFEPLSETQWAFAIETPVSLDADAPEGETVQIDFIGGANEGTCVYNAYEAIGSYSFVVGPE